MTEERIARLNEQKNRSVQGRLDTFFTVTRAPKAPAKQPLPKRAAPQKKTFRSKR